MIENEIKENFSKNLVKLRKESHLTQAGLAEKLNYSDKAVSKWECGEVLPDIETFSNIASYFNITVNDLIYQTINKKIVRNNPKHLFITLLSTGLVWLVAAFVYWIFYSYVGIDRIWIVFIAAFPASFIVLTVLTKLWFNGLWLGLSVSGLVWSCAGFLFLLLNNPTNWFIFIIGLIMQGLVVLWFFMRKAVQKEKALSK